MKPLLFIALLAAAGVGSGMLGCSSSTTSQTPPGDGGGGQDGTSPSQDSGSGGDSSSAGMDSSSLDSSNGNDSATAGEAGTDGGETDSSTTVSDSGTASDTGTTTDAAVNCGSNPTLHVDTAGTIFCGYDFDAGADLSCTTGQQCCLGGYLDGGTFAEQVCSTWSATGTGCTNPPGDSIGIACGQNADCTANGFTGSHVACCLQGATAPADMGCTYPKATLGTAVVCESTSGNGCAAGEIQICSATSDCPTGMTCTPGKWKLFQVGFCM
jgi:hypothetical protein